ncbi:PAC2 family protein [Halorussus salilacus]|uniref:proteasome assembly chaperone family protein n=1 Tax=Halorussus salilacus TaxID=2953750 RepID=UPI0020A1A377|nr:PAC2 family protein [Halorussus salilacus]USZ68188.1 PAC2 family protein [Halorussus salilacus]
MATDQHQSASFDITAEEPQETLLAGFSQFGLAGLTAVDFLVDQLDFEETGHVTADQLPAITPFENGRPRHHTRLFSHADRELTVLVGELFVPVWAAKPFSDAVLDWTETNDVEEIAVLNGITMPHAPEEHQVFYVATDDYRERRLADAGAGTEVPPMGRGFLDGVNAELVARGMRSSLRTAVFVTPVHAQAPDVDAAIRLLETVEQVYGLDVDTEPLEAFAAEVREYYEELSNRLSERADAEMPEDRMYM